METVVIFKFAICVTQQKVNTGTSIFIYNILNKQTAAHRIEMFFLYYIKYLFRSCNGSIFNLRTSLRNNML